MFHHIPELAYTVRVDKPNPVFARMLQQAIGGIEGEMRVMNQYLFQGWGQADPKYRAMLLSTGTEEIGHIEMLATAVAMNLQGAPTTVSETAALNPAVAAKMGGQDPRHFLSAGLHAMASDANGVPFDGSHVYASGNIVADMYANVTAEATGRALATRLYEATDDPGMKDMLSFLIARDTMHQQQWLTVLEELGGPQATLPVPNDFPQEQEHTEFSYAFFKQSSMPIPADARFATGPSLDGKGQYTLVEPEAYGQAPQPPLTPPAAHNGPLATDPTAGGGVVSGIAGAVKDVLS